MVNLVASTGEQLSLTLGDAGVPVFRVVCDILLPCAGADDDQFIDQAKAAAAD